MALKRPNDSQIEEQVGKLHASDWLLYVATTGATGTLMRDLWSVPGSSHVIVGNQFPYGNDQLDSFLERRPKQYCSALTARMMAAKAFAEARRCAEQKEGRMRPCVGLGMTAAVGTNRPLKGDHRVHVAVKTQHDMWIISAVFGKNPETGLGLLSRREEGETADLLALDALLIAADISCEGLDWSCPEMTFVHDEQPDPARKIHLVPPLTTFGKLMYADDVLITPEGETPAIVSGSIPHDLDPDRHIIFPGSFNPLHRGHELMAKLAEENNPGMEVVYQMTATHPVKGEIPREVLLQRAEQFRYRKPVLLMHGGGLYVEKARLLPGFSFLVGVDAVLGLLDQKYYGGTLTGLLATLDEFNRLGTRFLVVGREMNGTYVTLDEVPVPSKYRHLFKAVSGRWDVSSTELRNK